MKRKIKNSNKQSGITLVALVITIIVLLILATISIQSLTNTGLFQKANEAKDKTKNATENQAKTLNEYEDELNKYLSNEKEEDEDKLADKVKVGDYVSYIPDTVTNTDTKYTTLISNLEMYSGSDANTTSTLTQEKDLKWRVLDVQNGQVRLISETPTTSKIELNGVNGYNNAVKLLDDACNILYNNSKLVSKVQNLKIEDIQNKMKTDYTKLDNNYGKIFTLNNKYYTNILLKEKGQTINGNVGIELDLSEQKEFINQTTKEQADSLKIKYTFWYKEMKNEDFKDTKYYELFMNDGENDKKYWLSSRCIYYDSDNADFNIRLISNMIHTGNLSNSNGYDSARKFSFRPVVTLNSNVKIDNTNSGDGSTSEQAYAIK